MKQAFGALGGLVALASPATAQAPQTAPAPSTGFAYSRPIELAKPVFTLKRDAVAGTDTIGGLCLWSRPIYWNTNNLEEKAALFWIGLRDKLKEAGFTLARDPNKLFGNSDDVAANFVIGVSIDRIDADLCYPKSGFDNFDISKGTATVDVEWKLYSQLERKVVFTLKTTSAIERKKSEGGGRWSIVIDAVGEGLQQLLRDQKFVGIFTASPADGSVAHSPPVGLVTLGMRGATAAPMPITQVVASTVVIFANGGEGSGFLVSPDGYVLTNQHVVGASQYVKVRWSDGAELLGEVVRSDKGRDIAMIKTDAKGRKPLPLRIQPVTVGEDIYAVGAPTGAQFRNTVTKGIVSATRVFNGYNFIQGDVAVTHGNSGGPIVDAKGQVVGLTDLGIDGAPMLNLFIPIGEALGFLGLQMTP